MVKKERNKFEEILRRYFTLEYPERIRRMVQEWLVSEKNEEEKDAALRDIFDRSVDYDVKPAAWSYKMLEKFHRKAGIARPIIRRTPFNRARPLLRIAAVLLPAAVVAGTLFWMLDKQAAIPVATHITPSVSDSLVTQTGTIQPERRIEVIEGVQKEVTLADGTHVWINSGSTLTYPEVFADGERRVTLKGEAFFEVEHDASKPFTVHTGHLDIRVLGTKFDVKAYPGADFTEIALFEGSVEVTAANHSEKLTPGDRMTYRHESGAMEVERFTAQTAQDWRSATIFADEKSVPQILKMVANYYDVDIDFDAASLPAGQRYAVGFGKNEPVEKVLDLLVEISGGSFSYERRNDTIKIYGRK